MKRIACLILFYLPLLSFAQEIVKTISHSDGNKEEYYVLKSDKKIRYGPYQKINPLNTVLMEGFYKNDLKDSTWIERWVSTAIKSKGNYLMGERVGIWEFYDTKGALEQRYDFTNNELVFDRTFKQNKDKVYKVILGADTIQTVLERAPLYIGGRFKMQSAMTKGIDFPRFESGDVTVSFIIDKNGKASNHKIVNSLSKECDKAALKMAKQIPDNWMPAILNGQPVDVEYILPISFRKMF
jgi:antitoxin component YwqK of YwqJK toxin-antitoxin module